MNVLIVYDTVFGNTEKIALSIGEAMQSNAFVKVINIKDFSSDELNGTDLLLFGSPTRGFQATPAINDTLKALPANSLAGLKSAAFDTRLRMEDIKSKFARFIVNRGGFAAKKIDNQLKKKSAVMLTEPAGFLVTGDQGKDMVPGEPDRATQWAKTLLEKA